MKKIITLFLLTLFVTSFVQSQSEKHQVVVGLFTPAYLAPETLNGQVKEIYERNYFANEKAGPMVKGDRLTITARDTIGWTRDFHVIYDEAGHLLLSEQVDENDKVINNSKLSYKGDKMEKAHYFQDDTLRSVTISVYDENGMTKVMERWAPEDTLILKVKLVWDENGHVTGWHFHNSNGEPTGKYVFTLDENGKRTGYKYYNKDGEKTFEQQYTYNDMGFMKKQVLINREGEKSVAEYEYKYDDMGNWILCKGSTPHHADIIAERIITYYE
ncbi:MAG: hypothetical protein ACP5E3_10375 [Bacteroidales bacterium]